MRRSVRVGAVAALTWFAAAVLLDANRTIISEPVPVPASSPARPLRTGERPTLGLTVPPGLLVAADEVIE